MNRYSYLLSAPRKIYPKPGDRVKIDIAVFNVAFADKRTNLNCKNTGTVIKINDNNYYEIKLDGDYMSRFWSDSIVTYE